MQYRRADNEQQREQQHKLQRSKPTRVSTLPHVCEKPCLRIAGMHGACGSHWLPAAGGAIASVRRSTARR
jgi:hypothetical protein